MSKLAEICARKREEIDARKRQTPLGELLRRARQQAPSRGFEQALRKAAGTGFALIAEIKRASPSKGLIREDFRPADHARAYAQGGATCLSVLTDRPFFMGDEEYLRQARVAAPLPVLRKDFILDPWQVVETRAIGADAMLLIVAVLEDSQLAELEAAALEMGLDVLVEVHDEAEMERAARLRSRLIGINNRDLRSFTTDLATSERLAPLAPDGALVIAESGIGEHTDCLRLERAGIRAFLVGESLMRHPDVAAATRALLGADSDRGT